MQDNSEWLSMFKSLWWNTKWIWCFYSHFLYWRRHRIFNLPVSGVYDSPKNYSSGILFVQPSAERGSKRKNRHLIETVHTFLIEPHVPASFLGWCGLTSCYLINRMPSSSIQNQILYSILFPQSHLYYIPSCLWEHMLYLYFSLNRR